MSHAAGLRELQGRPNVLLLGDSLGDLTMADGVSEHQNILTIGFLNDKVRPRSALVPYTVVLGFGFSRVFFCVSGGREEGGVHQLL